MIVQLCEKHQKKSDERLEAAGLPKVISRDTHGHLSDKDLQALLIHIGTVALDEEDFDCSDCRIISQTIF